VNPTEIGDLLGLAAIYDNRKVAEPDVMAWLQAIGDLPYDDSRAAVIAHYSASTDRIMPGHIRAAVKRTRTQRIAATPLPAPPAELTGQPGRYQAAIRDGIRRLADGLHISRAIGGTPRDGEPPEDYRRARAALDARHSGPTTEGS
jgi:hypothetical protein